MNSTKEKLRSLGGQLEYRQKGDMFFDGDHSSRQETPGDQPRAGRNKTLLAQETVIKTLNRMMVGCANYFCLGPVGKAYGAIERHARRRLRQWLCAKHKIRWPATKQYPEAALHQELGLVQLSTRTTSVPWATA